MSTMMLLSSSPPPMFARDPTPFEYSPSRSQSSTGAQDVSCSPKRFKISNTTRDSFSTGFRSASSMLAVKPTAENVPVQSPGKGRFKTFKSILPVRKTPPFIARNGSAGLKFSTLLEDKEMGDSVQRPSTATASNIALSNPVTTPQSKPVRRRLDWTPIQDDEDGEGASVGDDDEATRFMSDFGFKPTLTEHGPAPNHSTGIGIIKKTRIELVQAPCSGPIVIKASKGSARAKQKPAKPKKVKAATKKAKTITELVTSHHRGRNKTESPMAEFLVASQARTWDAPPMDVEGIEVATKALKRKAGVLKPQPRKRQLLSPASAMKAFDRQETIFGSASQLARDEPRIEADLSSDPFSPLRTQLSSHGSITPQVSRGSTRFVKSRNLWGAADRDDDNALLHVDSVDLYDTPLARNAYVGKDALIAPPLLSTTKLGSSNEESRGGKKNKPAQSTVSEPQHPTTIVDVDDFSSPALGHRQSPSSLPKQSIRQLHTSARSPQKPHADEYTAMPAVPEGLAAANPSKAPPARPNYMGMQTGDLQTLIKSYGFKAIRSRDKMVDLLNKCWDEKEARRAVREGAQEANEAPPAIARHADLLSNVHDLSSRPQPKAKKMPKTSRAASKAKATTDTTVKEPKKRKKAAVELSPADKPKRGRPKKSKAALSEEKIIDVDDVDDDFTNLTTLRETSQVSKTQTIAPNEPQCIPVTDNARSAQNEGSEKASITRPDIQQQIHAAILHQSKQAADIDSWDHVRSPTWHEKMLMYDPIIIEELARWLNAEGLNSVKEDREVTTVEVRDWCESRGVCCIFNGGWRGQASKVGD